MKILEKGTGRKARCPICNCMFIFDKQDVKIAEQNYSIVICPDCETEILFSREVLPKADIYIINK